MLTLKPGRFSDPLTGSFIERNLDNGSIEYEALSYVWGSTYSNCYIDIDGWVSSITGNLEDALRRLRKTDDVRYVWADAICINQLDIVEKNEQVALMGDVYERAATVVIWLGLANERTEVGMRILDFIVGGHDLNGNTPWMSSPPELLRAGLNDVVGRPYFRRIWVVQELVRARKLIVMCGALSFGWNADATSRLLTRLKFAEISPAWEEAGLVGIDMTPMVEMIELANIKAHGLRPTIGSLDIMHNMRHRNATDPRDMVFALSSLAPDMKGFQIDYTMSRDELYHALFKHIEEVYGDFSNAPPATSSASECI